MYLEVQTDVCVVNKRSAFAFVKFSTTDAPAQAVAQEVTIQPSTFNFYLYLTPRDSTMVCTTVVRFVFSFETATLTSVVRGSLLDEGGAKGSLIASLWNGLILTSRTEVWKAISP